MSDSYPEYLNPFAEDFKPKNKLSISHSFKEFKRTLRQSFRIKKKEEAPVTIRHKTDTIKRIPVSYPNYRPDALPRSRFQERLRCEPSTSTQGPNPFDERAEDRNGQKQTIRKKAKKKAPLPPKSLSSQDINNDNLDDPHRGSNWSLTSADTNYSSSVQEIGDDFEEEEVNEAVLEKIMDFNKEMEKLQDDSNNNIITTDEIDQKNNSNTDIPKLSTSTEVECSKEDISKTNICPIVTDSTEIENKKEESDVPKTHGSCPNEVDGTEIENKKEESGVPKTHGSCPNEMDGTEIENKKEESDVSKLDNLTETDSTKVEESSKETEEHLPEDKVVNNEEGLICSDITNDVISENNINSSTKDDEGTDEEPFLYYEKQSLYIAGSRDELNESDTYTNRISLRISEKSDDFDICNNNDLYDEKQCEPDENEDETPVPKQRKNKLTKSALLGM